MTAWTEDELRRVTAAVELQISSRRSNGTLLPAVTFWHAVVGGELYVRHELDAALHAKYDGYAWGPVGAITGDDVLHTTLLVMPRS